MSDQQIDPKALKMIEIAKAKALLKENGIFVVPKNNRKQKEGEVDNSELRSTTSKANSSKKSESGRSVAKSEVTVSVDGWIKLNVKDKSGRFLWQCKKGKCQAKYRSDDRWKHIC